jgi:hypothetical protein
LSLENKCFIAFINIGEAFRNKSFFSEVNLYFSAVFLICWLKSFGLSTGKSKQNE